MSVARRLGFSLLLAVAVGVGAGHVRTAAAGGTIEGTVTTGGVPSADAVVYVLHEAGDLIQIRPQHGILLVRDLTERRHVVSHICHDATQPTERSVTILSGVIPSLANLPREKTITDFVHKAEAGAQVPLSAGSYMSRGRMPVFDYLTEPELASAYAYLNAYPPR
jgi:hypothetical protein